ncbi:MAG: Uncharacterised protein [Prochlorococcus marinus str. MIT 9313]|nr:MAG: Uncharacterised protein [Prochlorococcus marinus str. MIT 9313]
MELQEQRQEWKYLFSHLSVEGFVPVVVQRGAPPRLVLHLAGLLIDALAHSLMENATCETR